MKMAQIKLDNSKNFCFIDKLLNRIVVITCLNGSPLTVIYIHEFARNVGVFVGKSEYE